MSDDPYGKIENGIVRKTYVMISDDTAIEKEEINGEAYYTFRFPPEFLHSTNPRSIEVHHAKVSAVDSTTKQMKIPNDIVLHADFIKRDAYLDHTVMLCNEVRTKYKKYAYYSKDQYYRIWFSLFTGKDADEKKIPLADTHFIIELMLIY